MSWLKWLGWGTAVVLVAYITVVLLFALYFALASYIPLLYRKVRRYSCRSAQRPGAEG